LKRGLRIEKVVGRLGSGYIEMSVKTPLFDQRVSD
jgi:hypothetical protein